MHVYLLPADARFEGQLAARVVQGQAAARKDGRGEGRLQKVVRSLIEQWERSAVSRGKTGAGRHGGGSEIGGGVGAIRHTLHLGVGMASIAARHPHSQGGNPPLSTRNWAKRPKAHAPKRIAAQARTSEAWGVVPLPRARFRHIGKTFPQLLSIFSPVSHGPAPPHSRQWTITCWIIPDLEIF